MDLQSFIQSGLLEAYVAGQCSPAEQKQVEQMLAKHPELRAELDKIERALEQFALANAVAPPSGLKDNIMDRLQDTSESPAPARNDSRKGNRVWLATLAVLGWAIAGWFFWQQRHLSNDVQQLEGKNTELQQQVNDCAERRKRTDAMAALLRDTDTRPVTLTDGKSYHITVFNNKLRKECALDLNSVPTPDKDRYFQCWALMANGSAVDLGMVELNAAAGWQPLNYIENAVGYAISIEKSPKGNPTPTQVLASGNIDAG